MEIKKKLGANFNSVRKAFLELDSEHRGSIGAEELAKFIGA
jgi:Ca2+-binding EF-hand superfamily protein